MTKIVNSLRILATTDSGLLSWQRSARLAVAKAADEIERLREALELAEDAVKMLIRTSDIELEHRRRALTMLERAHAGRSVIDPPRNETK